MSRSYAKPNTPFHLAYQNEIEELKKDVYNEHRQWNFNKLHRWFENWDELNEAKWKYKTKKQTGHRHSYRFPKSYRKEVKKIRKQHDKNELYKELHYDDYEGVYDDWNCKSSDPWWYW